MEKNKKERLQRELRNSLKPHSALAPHLLRPTPNSPLLAKTYPHILQLNSLRILTLLEITYLLEIYLDLIEVSQALTQKTNPAFIEDFRIGIIGGGITARLLLNSLLPLSKDGLQLSNVTVSTRQPQNFKLYAQNFGVRVLFDNQLIAKEADFLVVATPASLDNWIIADLREPLQQRIKASQKQVSKPVTTTQVLGSGKLISEKSQLAASISGASDSKKKQIGTSPQLSGLSEPPSKRNYRPLVYILTSDFSDEKCKRLFNFPVLTPSIRAKDMKIIAETLKIYVQENETGVEQHEKILAWWLTKEGEEPRIQSADSRCDGEGFAESQLQSAYAKYAKTPFAKILNTLAYVAGSSIPQLSLTSSISNTVSVSQQGRDRKHEQSLALVMDLTTAHGNVDSTLLKKIKKWKMAHNNFVA